MKPDADPGTRASAPTPTRTDLPDAGPALFRLVRFWSRRWINRASRQLTGEMRHVQYILVVEAVSAAEIHPEGTTVATVAHQLGLDHSGASRMVREATAAGYLSRDASKQDRRRASLRLTDRGRTLLDGSRHWQRDTFDRLTADWSPEDRRQLAAYLERLNRCLDVE